LVLVLVLALVPVLILVLYLDLVLVSIPQVRAVWVPMALLVAVFARPRRLRTAVAIATTVIAAVVVPALIVGVIIVATEFLVLIAFPLVVGWVWVVETFFRYVSRLVAGVASFGASSITTPVATSVTTSVAAFVATSPHFEVYKR
jgi:hypothetical protein